MAKYDKKSQDKVEKAMHEYKHGELKSGSGKKVKSKDQAIAIGLSEARKEGSKAPKKSKSSSSKSSSSKSKRPSASKKSSSSKSTSRKQHEKTFVEKTAKKVKDIAGDVVDFVEDTTKDVKKKVKKIL